MATPADDQAHGADTDDEVHGAQPEGEGFDAAGAVAAMAETIADEARRHPYRTLGIALGTGYVLGGGVPRFVVRMATMAALRSLGRAILTSAAVTELARNALGGRGTRSRSADDRRGRNGRARA